MRFKPFKSPAQNQLLFPLITSSLMSSTRASADRLIMALVTTPDCPSAAPRASPGKMYLGRLQEG